MAGPVATVLIPPHENIRGRVDVVLREVADIIEGDDIWIDKRPFIASLRSRNSAKRPPEGKNSAKGPPEGTQEVDAELAPLLGWAPAMGLSLSAMCNDDVDHRLLAGLCVRFAELFGGIVELHGTLFSAPSLDGERSRDAVAIPHFFHGVGTLFLTNHKIDDGHYGTSQHADAALLRAWLRAAAFRMVK
jgi:Family of unknown function (DUF6368)